MPNAKSRITFYLTEVDRSIIKKRASLVGRNMSDYLAELVMWDNKFRIVENARAGTLQTEEDEAVEYAIVEK
jgi:uncharacterized protein (DUF1778 family)